MSSEHVKRQMLIDENVPKLIKSLTGFRESDENYRLCEEYAFNSVACQRFLSVNSHQVRRRANGLSERFMANNYTRYGERLMELVQQFVTEPLCTEHYELDVQWSILQFLLDVSKNPVAALAANKEKIRTEDSINGEDMANDQLTDTMNDLMNSLMQHNITDNSEQSGSKLHADDSDLSDWSDEDSNHENDASKASFHISTELNQTTEAPISLRLVHSDNMLRPPRKPKFYTVFDASKAIEWKTENTQPAWWLNEVNRVKIVSDYPAAKMCEIFRTNESVSTLSEWCLLREILWMLQLEPEQYEPNTSPNRCLSKFFTLNVETNEIIANENISIPSVTVEGIRPILNEFAEIMTIIYRFKKLNETIFQHVRGASDFIETSICAPPYTIQCYAQGLKDFLSVVAEAIIKLEMELIEQDPMEMRSIVYVYNKLLPYFRLMKKLYDIHSKVYIDFKTNPGHVCVSHLLAGLLNEMNTTALTSRLNLAASLFLVSIRFYLNVINTWLHEGRFDDWRNEFPIQKCLGEASLVNLTSNSYQLRPLPSNTPSNIQNQIESCNFIKLLRTESIEMGYIMNILYNLGKVIEMKDVSHLQYEELSEQFMANLWQELNKFRINSEKPETEIININDSENDSGVEKDSVVDYCHGLANEADVLLFMVFEQYMMPPAQSNSEKTKQDNNPWSCYQIYKKLNEITDFQLPLAIVIDNCIKDILNSRISVANAYVFRIFRDEYKVFDHIKNLQRVYLLGAGDLMLTFYSNLFQNMNAGDGNWNNSYLLTVQLQNILTTKYPEMHSLFSVQLTASDSHIKPYLKAINDIVINYAVRDTIRDVIHEKSLLKYNAVFRFLLQIKWAIWTLETLQFPIAFKKRPPYQPLTMIDLIFKRLALVRSWLIYSIQCIHSHLMTFVIQSMGQQFIKKMERVNCLRGIIELHDSYIDTIYQHCFAKDSDAGLRKGIEQLMNLVMVLHDEWNNIQTVDSHGDFIDGENEFDISGSVKQIDIVESTYIDCHCFIAETLSKEVYTKDRTDLASLSAAFNCSCPY